MNQLELRYYNPSLIQTIAKQVGIDTATAESIVRQLAPILMGGAKSNLQSDKDSGSLIKKIESDNYAEMFDKPEEAVKKKDLKEIGDDILADLTGSKENSREVAKHVEQETGVSSNIIKMILPMLAPMIIGALTKSTGEKSDLTEASGDTNSMTAILVELIDQDHDGSMIDDVMGMATKVIIQ